MSGQPPPYSEASKTPGSQPFGYGAPPPPPSAYGQPQTQYGAAPPYGQNQYGPPPPGGVYNQPQYSSNTVVVTQPPLTIVQQYRESPVQTTCPFCHAQVITATHYETGTLAWIICMVLCFVGLGAGCCLIPFCVDGCKDVVHSCPNCRQVISRYSRM